MQRHRNGIGIVLQNARGAIALMHITIENQNTLHLAAAQQVAADNGQIIEHAKAGGEIVMGMVGATGQMAGQAVL